MRKPSRQHSGKAIGRVSFFSAALLLALVALFLALEDTRVDLAILVWRGVLPPAVPFCGHLVVGVALGVGLFALARIGRKTMAFAIIVCLLITTTLIIALVAAQNANFDLRLAVGPDLSAAFVFPLVALVTAVATFRGAVVVNRRGIPSGLVEPPD